MARKQEPSLTRKIGGNRAIVLGIIIVMLVLFTVDLYVLPALGVSSRAGDYIKFTVNGREVTCGWEKYQAGMGDWQRFQLGQSMLSGAPRGTAMEDFLEDLMLGEIARDAGVAITDETLAEFLRTNPLFQGSGGEFETKAYEEALRKNYQGISSRAFEDEARRYLLLDHFRKVYFHSFLAITDEECWKRWKGEHPKVAVAYAWQGVGTIREALKPEDVKDEEVEATWKDPAVQGRHRTPPRRAFEAAWVRIAAVEDAAFDAAREAWKDDPDLALKEGEAREFWWASQKYDFNLANLDGATLEALRKENGGEEPKEPGKDGTPPPEAGTEEAQAPAEPSPAELDTEEQYRRYWRRRAEKEVWLRKLLEKVRREIKDPAVPLADAAAKWSRPGLAVSVHRQEAPLDQYEVEKLEGPGGSPIRFVLNDYDKPEQVGSVHAEAIQRTAFTDRLDQRGWVVVRVTGIVPEAVPPLADVRAKVVSEFLDDRARERAKARLAALRKAAEEGPLPLEEAAKKDGFECATTDPFNEFSWRPPLPRPAPGEVATAAPPVFKDEWKDPARRLSAILGKYYPLREVVVGALSDVFDDASVTGACYLVQVKSRAEPRFEEMSQAHQSQVRRVLARERMMALGTELSYSKLKDRLGLFVAGEPAKESEPSRRGRR